MNRDVWHMGACLCLKHFNVGKFIFSFMFVIIL